MYSTLNNKASFTSVATNRLASPIVAWVNEAQFSEQAAMENAYCIRQDYEPTEAYVADERTLYADRYGGNGVGSSGGSGRCATLGNIQVKGVGRTSLVTADADPYHTSGTVMLREAAREAIFSKVFESFLPYGVVQPLAIVLTGGMFSYDVSGTDALHQRALLLREFALRPAHYLRNVYHKAEATPDDGGFSRDTTRTSLAINMLDKGFEAVFGTDVTGTVGIERINLGLKLMAHRIAAQLAASFAKRIFQTSLNCSNIALDGRFIDFGVTTFVEGYRKRAWAKKWQDQWSQHAAVLRTLHLLRFAVQKYWHEATGNLITETELVAEFTKVHQTRMEVEMIKMTGAPEAIVMLYPVESRQRFFRCLRSIYTRGADEKFIIWPATLETQSNPAPEKTGCFDLNEILTFAATCKTDDALDSVLAAHLNDAVLRQEFTHCYGDLRRFVLSHADQHREAAEHYWTMQAIRLNADLSCLKYELLDDQLMKFNEQPEGLGDFIDTTIDAGRYILQADHPDIAGQGFAEQIKALSESSEHWHNMVLKSATKTDAPDAIVNHLKAGFAS